MALAVLALTTLAWTSSWDSIQSAAKDIQSVQATFTQEKHLQILAHPEESAIGADGEIL